MVQCLIHVLYGGVEFFKLRLYKIQRNYSDLKLSQTENRDSPKLMQIGAKYYLLEKIFKCISIGQIRDEITGLTADVWPKI